MFDIRRFAEGKAYERVPEHLEIPGLKTPGDVISSDPAFMRGHGTYVSGGKIIASVAGVVERVNRLYSVKSRRTRFIGEIGDVVVGRICEVQQKRWKVDINSRLDAILMLSSVNLPGGELRRKTEEDELMMRHYLKEGDLISAEVQSVFSDGSLSLHTRSLKYGKLSQGTLVRVSPSLIQRTKTHFYNLPCGAHMILPNNGNVWISPTVNEDEGTGGFAQNLEPVPKIDRETIARLRNCVVALSNHNYLLSDTVVMYAYEASTVYPAKELLKPEIISEIVEKVAQRIDNEGL